MHSCWDCYVVCSILCGYKNLLYRLFLLLMPNDGQAKKAVLFPNVTGTVKSSWPSIILSMEVPRLLGSLEARGLEGKRWCACRLSLAYHWETLFLALSQHRDRTMSADSRFWTTGALCVLCFLCIRERDSVKWTWFRPQRNKYDKYKSTNSLSTFFSLQNVTHLNFVKQQ